MRSNNIWMKAVSLLVIITFTFSNSISYSNVPNVTPSINKPSPSLTKQGATASVERLVVGELAGRYAKEGVKVFNESGEVVAISKTLAGIFKRIEREKENGVTHPVRPNGSTSNIVDRISRVPLTKDDVLSTNDGLIRSELRQPDGAKALSKAKPRLRTELRKEYDEARVKKYLDIIQGRVRVGMNPIGKQGMITFIGFSKNGDIRGLAAEPDDPSLESADLVVALIRVKSGQFREYPFQIRGPRHFMTRNFLEAIRRHNQMIADRPRDEVRFDENDPESYERGVSQIAEAIKRILNRTSAEIEKIRRKAAEEENSLTPETMAKQILGQEGLGWFLDMLNDPRHEDPYDEADLQKDVATLIKRMTKILNSKRFLLTLILASLVNSKDDLILGVNTPFDALMHSIGYLLIFDEVLNDPETRWVRGLAEYKDWDLQSTLYVIYEELSREQGKSHDEILQIVKQTLLDAKAALHSKTPPSLKWVLFQIPGMLDDEERKIYGAKEPHIEPGLAVSPAVQGLQRADEMPVPRVFSGMFGQDLSEFSDRIAALQGILREKNISELDTAMLIVDVTRREIIAVKDWETAEPKYNSLNRYSVLAWLAAFLAQLPAEWYGPEMDFSKLKDLDQLPEEFRQFTSEIEIDCEEILLSLEAMRDEVKRDVAAFHSEVDFPSDLESSIKGLKTAIANLEKLISAKLQAAAGKPKTKKSRRSPKSSRQTRAELHSARPELRNKADAQSHKMTQEEFESKIDGIWSAAAASGGLDDPYSDTAQEAIKQLRAVFKQAAEYGDISSMLGGYFYSLVFSPNDDYKIMLQMMNDFKKHMQEDDHSFIFNDPFIVLEFYAAQMFDSKSVREAKERGISWWSYVESELSPYHDEDKTWGQSLDEPMTLKYRLLTLFNECLQYLIKTKKFRIAKQRANNFIAIAQLDADLAGKDMDVSANTITALRAAVEEARQMKSLVEKAEKETKESRSELRQDSIDSKNSLVLPVAAMTEPKPLTRRELERLFDLLRGLWREFGDRLTIDMPTSVNPIEFTIKIRIPEREIQKPLIKHGHPEPVLEADMMAENQALRALTLFKNLLEKEFPQYRAKNAQPYVGPSRSGNTTVQIVFNRLPVKPTRSELRVKASLKNGGWPTFKSEDESVRIKVHPPKPGTNNGTLSISADGGKPQEVAATRKVTDFYEALHALGFDVSILNDRLLLTDEPKPLDTLNLPELAEALSRHKPEPGAARRELRSFGETPPESPQKIAERYIRENYFIQAPEVIIGNLLRLGVPEDVAREVFLKVNLENISAEGSRSELRIALNSHRFLDFERSLDGQTHSAIAAEMSAAQRSEMRFAKTNYLGKGVALTIGPSLGLRVLGALPEIAEAADGNPVAIFLPVQPKAELREAARRYPNVLLIVTPKITNPDAVTIAKFFRSYGAHQSKYAGLAADEAEFRFLAASSILREFGIILAMSSFASPEAFLSVLGIIAKEVQERAERIALLIAA